MRPIVKICGLMRAEDVSTCVRYGTDIIGFVVDYPHPVPWNLSLNIAKDLVALVSKPAETCVVTGGSLEKIMHVAKETRPDYIQLHCGETLSEVEFLVQVLGKYGTKVIKTLFPDTPDLEKAAVDFSALGIHAILFDPRSPKNATHGGLADLSAFARLKRAASCPVILAGGITPENVANLVYHSQPKIIDLMSGVESERGVKDEAKVAAIFQALMDTG